MQDVMDTYKQDTQGSFPQATETVARETIPHGQSDEQKKQKWLKAVHQSPKKKLVFDFKEERGIKKISRFIAEEGLLLGPECGLLSNTRRWILQGDTHANKAKDFIGKRCLGQRATE